MPTNITTSSIQSTTVQADFVTNQAGTGAPTYPNGVVFAGGTSFGDGSAAAPSITFTADTNTGIFRKAADSLGFSGNGIEVGSYDAAGGWTLGIDGAVLHTVRGTELRRIAGTVSGNVTKTFYTGTGVGTLRATLGVAGTTDGIVTGTVVGDFAIDIASGQNMLIGVNGTRAFSISSAGAATFVNSVSTSAAHRGGWGLVPVGTVVAYNPGYYQNGTNGTFTVAGPATNSITDVNAFLNPQGWYVCNGASVNVAASPIWNAANRFLPKLDNSRFLMGSTTAGTVLDNNSTVSIAHDHSVTSNVTVSNHTLIAANIPSLTSTGATTGTGSTVATNTGGGTAHTHQGRWHGGGGSIAGVDNYYWSPVNGAGGQGGNVSSTHILSESGHTHGIPSLTVNSGITLSATYTNASPAAVTHSVTNNAVTSGAASVASVSVLPQYLSTYFIIRVF